MRRSATIDDAVFNFRVAGQLAVGGGAYGMLGPCGVALGPASAGVSRPELVATLLLLIAGWLVAANHRLVSHYARVDREHHRCTKERIQLGFLNAFALTTVMSTVAQLVFGREEAPMLVYYVFGLPAPIYIVWQGSTWWREANRMDRMKDNRCPTCGYDLRASPERCPECGMQNKPLRDLL